MPDNVSVSGMTDTTKPPSVEPKLRDVLLFLDGVAPLDGCMFGERPVGQGAFWWRSHLKAALGSALGRIAPSDVLREALDPWARVYSVSIAPFDRPGSDGVGPLLPTAWPTRDDLRRLHDLFFSLGGSFEDERATLSTSTETPSAEGGDEGNAARLFEIEGDVDGSIACVWPDGRFIDINNDGLVTHGKALSDEPTIQFRIATPSPTGDARREQIAAMVDNVAWQVKDSIEAGNPFGYAVHANEHEIEDALKRADQILALVSPPNGDSGLREPGQFLVDRLRDLDGVSSDADEFIRQFYGHVSQALSRFEAALKAKQPGEA